jgi:hypothetical protein
MHKQGAKASFALNFIQTKKRMDKWGEGEEEDLLNFRPVIRNQNQILRQLFNRIRIRFSV